MFNLSRFLFPVSLLFLLLLTHIGYAASPYGIWVRNNGVHIKVFRCQNGLGMMIVKAKKKSNVGKRIMCGAKEIGPVKWEGKILNVADDKTYSGTVTIIKDRLKLRGCVFGGLICKEDEWKKVE